MNLKHYQSVRCDTITFSTNNIRKSNFPTVGHYTYTYTYIYTYCMLRIYTHCDDSLSSTYCCSHYVRHLDQVDVAAKFKESPLQP